MLTLQRKAEANIYKLLSDGFAAVLDGWSHVTIRYVSLFKLVLNNLEKGFME